MLKIRLDLQSKFKFLTGNYLEGVAGVGVISMTRADWRLLPNQISDLLELAAVNVAVAV